MSGVGQRLLVIVTATATIGVPVVSGPTAHGATIHVPAGSFVMGHDHAERTDESPAHVVGIAAFELDATLVTRADFARFVDETHYVTSAEKIGFGVAAEEGMEDWAWQRVPHASWRNPFVRESEDARAFLADDAPVTMVSWDDAVAYCTHLGKRLPTEAEWEYAMRAGGSGTRYPWGDVPNPDGRYRLNFWQGASHAHNERKDGFVYVSPVTAFPPNAWGIYDAVGNVWQWTADRYDARAYAQDGSLGVVGGTGERVLRGGSWWCGACTCEGNGLFYRGKAKPDAPFDNNGFRCASSPQ